MGKWRVGWDGVLGQGIASPPASHSPCPLRLGRGSLPSGRGEDEKRSGRGFYTICTASESGMQDRRCRRVVPNANHRCPVLRPLQSVTIRSRFGLCSYGVGHSSGDRSAAAKSGTMQSSPERSLLTSPTMKQSRPVKTDCRRLEILRNLSPFLSVQDEKVPESQYRTDNQPSRMDSAGALATTRKSPKLKTRDSQSEAAPRLRPANQLRRPVLLDRKHVLHWCPD